MPLKEGKSKLPELKDSRFALNLSRANKLLKCKDMFEKLEEIVRMITTQSDNWKVPEFISN